MHFLPGRFIFILFGTAIDPTVLDGGHPNDHGCYGSPDPTVYLCLISWTGGKGGFCHGTYCRTMLGILLFYACKAIILHWKKICSSFLNFLEGVGEFCFAMVHCTMLYTQAGVAQKSLKRFGTAGY